MWKLQQKQIFQVVVAVVISEACYFLLGCCSKCCPKAIETRVCIPASLFFQDDQYVPKKPQVNLSKNTRFTESGTCISVTIYHSLSWHSIV